LVEVAIVVGAYLPIGQGRVLIGGALDGGAGRDLQAVEALVEAEGAAERGEDGIAREPGLDVRAAGIVGRNPQAGLRGDIGVAGDIEAAVDMAGEIRTVDIGRRGIDRAIERQRKSATSAWRSQSDTTRNSGAIT
jgi:hypothetical protein